MEKLKMHSPNLTQDNIARIRDLFPSCVVEKQVIKDGIPQFYKPNPKSDDKLPLVQLAIDFDQLRQELSESIVEGPQERYHLNWPGKREALLTANAPIAKTLRPCRNESVDFDTTKNLFIEGDNLDALKLLQETYLGKVKMIYIDPPYNTGNDFIYEDDFSESAEDFLRRSNQKDAEGNKMVANPASNGRFHSDWLSMMYSRLKLARNLLRNDGVIFVSIDENEVRGVRALCDEIFGATNFIAEIVWEKMYTTKNDASLVSTSHEYVICFARSIDTVGIGMLPRTAEMDARYSNPDNDPRGPWKAIPMYADGERKNGRFVITSPTGKRHEPDANSHWRYAEKDVLNLIADNRIYFGRTGDSQPNLKRFLSEVRDGVKAKSLWPHKDVGSNDTASRELRELFKLSRSPMSFPKPTTLIRRMLQLAAKDEDAIVLDFFAGSSTTAHAVMAFNAEDGGRRRHIAVQLPEACDTDSYAFANGFKTIAEISKERIRLAGTRIKAQCATTYPDIDVGFRVLKVDTSNMADVYYAPDALDKAKFDLFVDNIKPDRTPEDLLFQVMLDWGVDLALPITKQSIQGKDVLFVDGNVLAACFDASGSIDEAFVKELAKQQPLRVVFRDAGYKNSAVKINVEQIFKLLSPATEVKCI